MSMMLRRYSRAVALLALMLCVSLVAPSLVQAATFQLPAGKEVMVKFKAEGKISSGDVIAGVPLEIELAEPIMLRDKVLVEKGAAGKAVVTEVKKAGAPGKPGMIKVEFQEIETKGDFRTADNGPIKLTGDASHAGKGKKTLAFITIIGILFIKGGQGELDASQAYPAEIAETVVLTDEQ
jgi:hypothetical protein